MDELLKVTNLSKLYGDKKILDDVSFSIKQGEIVGLIGKNGAGKTTLMKIILGLTYKSSGEVLLKGDENYLEKPENMNQFGFLLDCKLFEYLNGFDNLWLNEKYRNSSVSASEQKMKIKEMLKFVDLQDNSKKVKSYSFGMKQRLGLAIALMGNPNVLILDEPFVGLDPVGVGHFIQYINEIRKKFGTTILISSHQLHEIEQLCDRYLLLKNAQIEEIVDKQEELSQVILAKKNSELIKNLKDISSIQEDVVSFHKDLLNEVLSVIYKNDGGISDIKLTNSSLNLEKFF